MIHAIFSCVCQCAKSEKQIYTSGSHQVPTPKNLNLDVYGVRRCFVTLFGKPYSKQAEQPRDVKTHIQNFFLAANHSVVLEENGSHHLHANKKSQNLSHQRKRHTGHMPAFLQLSAGYGVVHQPQIVCGRNSGHKCYVSSALRCFKSQDNPKENRKTHSQVTTGMGKRDAATTPWTPSVGTPKYACKGNQQTPKTNQQTTMCGSRSGRMCFFFCCAGHGMMGYFRYASATESF